MSSSSASSVSSSPPSKPKTPLLMLEASLASSGALLLSLPPETIKTRLQLQGELQKASEVKIVYKNMLHGIGVVGANEGILALYQGMSAAVVHQVVMNGIRFGLFDPLRLFLKEETFFKRISNHENDPQSKKRAINDVPVNMVSAFSTGVVGAFLGSPMFLIKTRLQSLNRSQQKDKVGEQHQYSGMVGAVKNIYSAQGIRGLWSGAVSCMFRTAVGSTAQIPVYSFVKDVGVMNYGWDVHDVRLHAFCSLMAATSITVFMTPVDVVMTRIFNHSKHDGSRSFFGIVKGMNEIFKIEGLAGLYKGSVPLFWRTLPHSLGTFVLLEQLAKHREGTTKRMFPFLYN